MSITTIAGADEKNARLDLSLRADSGYKADSIGYRVSANEWAAIVSICEGSATGRVLMAAPDLLEACESALVQLRVAVIANSGGLFDHDNVHEHIGVGKIMAAIAKATAA